MPDSNDRPNGSNGSNGHKPRTSGGIRFASRRLRDIEREAVERTLELNGNNQSAAARSLCISRPTLARKLNSYRASDGERSSNDDQRSSNDRQRSSNDEQRSNSDQQTAR